MLRGALGLVQWHKAGCATHTEAGEHATAREDSDTFTTGLESNTHAEDGCAVSMKL
jgi:hypothetical protein